MTRPRAPSVGVIAVSSMADALALTFVVGISIGAASRPFYFLVACCLVAGTGFGYWGYAILSRISEWYLLSFASYAPLLFGFGLFAVTGGPVFVIGLCLFLIGVATCGTSIGTNARAWSLRIEK